MREIVTTVLDALGLLALAAGVGLTVAGLTVMDLVRAADGGGLFASGVVVLVGSAVAAGGGVARKRDRGAP